MSNVALLNVRNLCVRYPLRGAMGTGSRFIRAVDNVSFDIQRAETVALVGESGSGKSTIARAIVQLTKAHSGKVCLDGLDLLALRGRELSTARRRVQMVFQDPYSSLDPSRSVGDSVGEPLLTGSSRMRASERDRRVAELFDMVGLHRNSRGRHPHEFSGGQRQRIAIARALAGNPDLVILDEAVSSLDLSTQNQILELLKELQRKTGVAYLFISHDLSVVRHLANRVQVLYFGRNMEAGLTDAIFDSPEHPYTKALLSAIPVPDPVVQRTRKRTIMVGELPDASNPPTGCVLHPRCPAANDICRRDEPEFSDISIVRGLACHQPWLV